MLTTLLTSVVLCAAPATSPAWPEKLGKPLLAKVDFAWPKPARFQEEWTNVSPSGLPLLRLQLAGTGAGHTDWYVAVPLEDGRWVLNAVTDKAPDLVTRSVTGESLALEGASPAVVVERLEGTVSTDALTSWSYVNTLLAANGPLYAIGSVHERLTAVDANSELTDEQRTNQRREIISQAERGELRELVSHVTRSSEALASWVNDNKRNDAMFEQLRSYRPMGTCSMDTSPQRTARVFAELAYARGDLGRFLQLQINIMGDQFERTAWSSYGEAAHSTEAERLTSTGIDLDTFLLGLGLATQQGHGAKMGAWRLARSIREAGRTEVLGQRLLEWAQQSGLDAYNRVRATQTWFYLQLPEREFRQSAEQRTKWLDAVSAVVERGEKLNLHPVAREWLVQQRK